MINSPYKGLMPYGEEDAPFFFGREAETEIITANLMASRLTLLYGPSGVGKSSVLRAGVAHHLRALARQNRVERGAPEFAVVVFSSWRDDPMAGLLASIAAEIGEPPDAKQAGFLNALKSFTDHIDGDLLIILDQFEEYFLYHPQEDGDGTFATEFPRVVNRPDLRVSFLISVREDALAKLDRFKGRIPNLFDNYLRIEHLDRAAARTAIEKPIAEFNRTANGNAVSIERELVEAVLDQVKTGQVVLGEAGRGVVEGEREEARIETPYLQLVMTRLWEETVGAGSSRPAPQIDMRLGSGATTRVAPTETVLRLQTLNHLGGAERIVRTHLDNTMSALPSAERDLAARTFNFLVTPSGTKIAHTARDLAEYANTSEAQLAPVLEKLTGSNVRILRPVAPPLPPSPGRGGAGLPRVLGGGGEVAPPRYEIFHDVLAPAMLDWRTRYSERQRQTEAERRLAVERRRVARLRLGLVGVSLVLLAMIALAIFAVQQRDAATRAQAEASTQRAEAVAQRDAAQRAQVETAAQRDVAEKAKADAVVQRDIAENERRLAVARELSVNAVNNLDVDPERSILLALQAISVSSAGGKPVLLEAEEALHRAVVTSRVLLTLRGHTASVGGVAFSPDGTRLATHSNGEGSVKVWDSISGRELLTLSIAPRGGPGTTIGPRVAFSPDGRCLAAIIGNTAKVWDAAIGKELLTLTGHSGTVSAVAFSPEGRQLATASLDKTAKLWDAESGREVMTLSGHTDFVSSIVFSPDGRYVATASEDWTAKLWNAATGRELLTLSGHTGSLPHIVFSPDGKSVATSSRDATAKVWDVVSGRVILTLSHPSAVFGVAFDPTGTRLATSGSVIKVWDVKTGQVILTLAGHSGSIGDIAFSPDGKRLASSGADTTARVWDVSSAGGSEWLTFANHSAEVNDVAYSPDGRRLATVSSDKTLRVWDAVTGKELLTLLGHIGVVQGVAFSPDGKRLATASLDTTARVWDSESGRSLLTLLTEIHERQGPFFGYRVAFSPDGKRLATVFQDNSAKVWDLETGKGLLTLSGHTNQVLAVAFSPNGQRLATVSADRTAKVWDVSTALNTSSTTGTKLLTYTGHTGKVTSVAFSPDGARVATGSTDGTVQVWDAETGKTLRTFAYESRVSSVAFSPDGKRLAAGGSGLTVKLWNLSPEVKGSEQPLTLYGHAATILSVAFSPDGKRLATASRDGTSRVYALPLEDIIAIAKSRVTRALTTDECQKYLHVEACP